MPPEPSVTSACVPLCECTFMYSSVLLPKSFPRPGPKSVSPAMYCSGVKVVVWWRWIVDMRAPYRDGLRCELLPAVDVVGCTCKRRVGHDVHGKGGHI